MIDTPRSGGSPGSIWDAPTHSVFPQSTIVTRWVGVRYGMSLYYCSLLDEEHDMLHFVANASEREQMADPDVLFSFAPSFVFTSGCALVVVQRWPSPCCWMNTFASRRSQ